MKRIQKILVGGICLGLILLYVKIAYQIPDNVFLRYYLIIGGIVIVGAVVFNYAYNLHFAKKMSAAMQLYRAGSFEHYIEEVEAIRRRSKGRFAISLSTINLSAGYYKLKQYEKAIELLESLSNVKLPGELQVVYCINLCQTYFYTGRADRAMELYESSQAVFQPYRNKMPHGGNIAIVDIFAAIEKKEYDRAAELLKTARNTWDDPNYQEDYHGLEERLHDAQAE